MRVDISKPPDLCKPTAHFVNNKKHPQRNLFAPLCHLYYTIILTGTTSIYIDLPSPRGYGEKASPLPVPLIRI